MFPRRTSALLIALWAAALGLVVTVLVLSPTGLAGAPTAGRIDPYRTSRLALNSLYVSVLGAMLGALWALLPAYVAARMRPGTSRVILTAFCILPLLVPPAVICVCAVRLFGANGWLANLLFPDLTASSAAKWSPVYTLTGTGIVLAWCFWPVSLLTSWAAFARVQRASEEAALLDADDRNVFWRVTLPSGFYGVIAGAAIVFLLAMTEFSVPESLRTQPVLVADVYTQFGVFYDGRAAALTAVTLSLIAGVALAAVHRLLSRSGGMSELLEPEVSAREAPRRAAIPRSWFIGAWVLAVLPTAAIVGTLLVTASGPKGLWSALRTTWELSRDEFRFSIIFSAFASVCCGVVGAILGAALSSLRRPALARLILIAAFLLPGPIAGMAFKLVMLLPPGSLPLGLDDWLASLDGTLVPLVAAHTLRFAPLVALLVEYPLRRYPRDLADAVRIESRRLLAGWRVWGGQAVWPLLVAGMLADAALVMGEVGATLLLIPPGPPTLSVRLMTLMHNAPTSEVSALCLLLTVPAFLILPFVVIVFRLFLLGSRDSLS